MSNNDYVSDDLVEVINSIVERQLRYYKSYIGTVKSVKPDGTLIVDSIEFGTLSNDPTTWITCLPGNKLQNSIPAKVGQNVEFRFNGDRDNPKWYSLDSTYISPNEGLNKFVIFENSLTTKIIFDATTNVLTLQNSGSTINLKLTGAIEIKGGITALEKSVLGESLQTQLNQLKADFDAHTHPTAALGPPSAPSSPTTADFSLVLSPLVKNN